MATPTTALPNPSTFPVEYDEDGEIIYFPHWQYWDTNTTKANLVNVNGGTFGKPVVEPMSIGIVHVVSYDTSWTEAKFKNQNNACNSDVWRDWQPGEAWISRIITSKTEINGVACTRVHRIVRCNEFGWNTQQLEMGYFYMSGTTTVPFSDEGIPLGMLQANGDRATSASNVARSDKPIKRRISFSGIGI